MLFLKLYRVFKEVFGHHGEKLGGIGCPVLVEECRTIGIGCLLQRLVFPTENPRPRSIH